MVRHDADHSPAISPARLLVIAACDNWSAVFLMCSIDRAPHSLERTLEKTG
jgi:hypothetical protein